MNNKTIIAFVIGLVAMFFLMKSCEGEPKVVTKMVTKTEIVKEPITKVEIKEVTKTVYVQKKSDSDTIIVFKDKPSEIPTTEAKEYKVTLNSNNAKADLTVTAKELFKIDGIISYPKETIKETTTITRDASGFYIYGSMPISSQITTPELGVMFQIKNKLIIGVGGRYDNIINNGYLVGTIAVKL